MGQPTLRISIQENDSTIGFTLVGRLAGPWVTELEQAWKDVSARLQGKRLSLDVRDLTYSDAGGKRVLREIFRGGRADFITESDWSHHFAEEIKSSNGTYTEGRV